MFKKTPVNNKSISMRKLVSGVGINDADYMVRINVNGKFVVCKYYQVWSGMILRCYSEASFKVRPTYKECTVCDEWLVFSCFKLWMQKQDWKGNHLDKDILTQGNKIYSPDSCVFVPKEINLLLNKHQNKRGINPIGVSNYRDTGEFLSTCSVKGKQRLLGIFKTSKEAFEVYRDYKYELIRKAALKCKEPIKSALLSYVISIKD